MARPRLTTRGVGSGGAIVNIASTVSVMAINDRFAYSTSKGAVLAMTYSVAKDYLEQNIRILSGNSLEEIVLTHHTVFGGTESDHNQRFLWRRNEKVSARKRIVV